MILKYDTNINFYDIKIHTYTSIYVFFYFQLYICLISIHAVYLAVQHFIVCIGKDWKGTKGDDSTTFLHFIFRSLIIFSCFVFFSCYTIFAITLHNPLLLSSS